MVWRCTEAMDPRFHYVFRTIGNPDGRCVEIVTGQNTMLFDRRLARRLALAILEIAGPAEELESDIAHAEAVEIVYAPGSHEVVGFRPHLPPRAASAEDNRAWIEQVRASLGPKAEQEAEAEEEHRHVG
ncbi:hypothetical protein MARCHEWKA_00550 [Brevundimonas phage vB_BpoS-Marchewka]|uniref:Uncharacterized protein n=1 Tax=Brevundimonas phage vB_BpoS-Marchewka TaxID=2948604 RepID=A0A9E7N2I9_9CAUD|nr:hypothetical protein MARCHEWKA_00550 [Brevundimonas phage vB_BpoS-Marchewka]